MNVKPLLPVAAVAALASLALTPHAQNSAQKIGFVNVEQVVQASPAFAGLKDLQTKAAADLKPITDQLDAIQKKGAQASAADRQQYDTLSKTYEGKAKTWNDQIGEKQKPILAAVDAAVSATAKAQGVTIVMNKAVAAQSQLVIYADEGATDLTDAVKKNLK